MSLFPLISHHLFVAAVKEKDSDSPAESPEGKGSAPPEIPVREIPLELLDMGNPPGSACPPDGLSWTGSV